MNSHSVFDVIVVGGGHAGTEAALAAARMGVKTLLLTHSIETIGQMSCNPAIGGIGKSHLVKEIDAMGGIMARAADRAGIQFRVLNRSKGPAVRATRAQADRILYKQAIRDAVENQPNLSIFQEAVDDLVLHGEKISGVRTRSGWLFSAPTVILTTGTFLAGKIHIGDENYQAGRAGDPPAIELAARLRELPLRVGRLKTGTPPRIDGRTIDYSKLEAQPGDEPVPVFSYFGDAAEHPRQAPCHITHTNVHTHEIIRASLHRSPMYNGKIESIGPRYCPSIEDKAVRFAERNSHQIFLEPEGLTTHEVYPNGISTSLPFETQLELVHSIRGLERAHITRPGYAIEYDFFDPRDLQPSLETKCIEGLFFAGQINGTTGYEEAAAQGLIAGINAAQKIKEGEPWCPRRDQAYIGVLIDDLVTRGTNEPYRMFTSRAEFRLILREDNADLRLTHIAHKLGCISEVHWLRFNEMTEALHAERTRLQKTYLRLDGISTERFVELFGGTAPNREYSLMDLLRRPQVRYQDLCELSHLGPFAHNARVQEQLEIEIKYAGYIDRQQEQVERLVRQEQVSLPSDLDYAAIPGLSNEVVQKLAQIRPITLGQASRISGITPAAISLLLIHLKATHRYTKIA